MGLLLAVCLLHLGLATTVQLIPRYYGRTKQAGMTTPTIYPLSSDVTADTENWYLHAWISAFIQVGTDICLLSMISVDTVKVCKFGSAIQIIIGVDNSAMPAVIFVNDKWYFIEVGSTNLGYYGSVQIRNGTPSTVPVTSPSITIKASSVIKYPDDPLPAGYYVRAK